MQEAENSSESDDYYDCTEKVVTPSNYETSKKITKSSFQFATKDKSRLENGEIVEGCYTEEEKLNLTTEILKLKEQGNEAFKRKMYLEAEELYNEGLRICPNSFSYHRAILLSNRSACLHYQNKKEEAIADCTEAIKLNPTYLKPLLRRAQLYEDTEKFDEALEDYQNVLNLEPTNRKALAASSKLPPMIEEKNEKLKEEMIGTLKDLGNKVLGKFGLSTDNFQLEQNPETGSYNIQFKQNP